MPTDIFPDIDIPVISSSGTTRARPRGDGEADRQQLRAHLTTTVNDIEHIESQSLTGISVIKIFFQPGAKIEAATAQVTASRRRAPADAAGHTPPLIIRYSASNVPILQLALESDSLSEQQLFDYGTNFIRADFATIQGAQMPWPYGGKQRQIMVDIDPQRLLRLGPVAARRQQRHRRCRTSSCPPARRRSASTSTRSSQRSPELLDQIATSRSRSSTARRSTSATSPTCATATRRRRTSSTSRARSPCSCRSSSRGARARSTSSSASATCCRRRCRAAQGAQGHAPLRPVDLRARVGQGVVKEAGIAAGLTALMLLVFLGSWRSTLIVLVSIPLSILVSIIVLSWLGQTLNVMTLGGMALAVGILVDDATVEIENVHRNMAQKKAHRPRDPRRRSEIASRVRLDALHLHRLRAGRLHHRRGQVALRAARDGRRLRDAHLVLPVAHARADDDALPDEEAEHHIMRTPRRTSHRRAVLRRVRARLRAAADVYGGWLAWALAHRPRSWAAFLVFVAARSMALFPLVGRDFFPSVDAGLIKLHVRGPRHAHRGDRAAFAQHRGHDPHGDPARRDRDDARQHRHPYSGINLSLSEGALISSADGEILIALKEEHRPTPATSALRTTLAAVPRPDVLLPRAGHLDAGAQLRARRAHRRPGRRRHRQRGRDLRCRRSRSPIGCAHPGAASTCTWPRFEAARAAHRRRPHDGGQAFGLTSATSRATARLARVERDRVAELLARQARRAVPRRGADPAVSRSTRSTLSTRRPISDRRLAPAPVERGFGVAHVRPGEHHALQRGADLTTSKPTSTAPTSAPSRRGCRRSSTS
jgi:hypothetical protein